MNLAWKEMQRNKSKFLIIGSVIFLISFLTFIISGLAAGLSQDNAALIKNMPDGQFYIAEDADGSYNFSQIDEKVQGDILERWDDATSFSIGMGFLNSKVETQHSVAFVASKGSNVFKSVAPGEIILDESMIVEGIKVGDVLTNTQFEGDFVVKGFVEQSKFSHAPVAFIHPENYSEMYRTNSMQLIFIPGDESIELEGLQAFSKADFLNSIPSYNAEQLSLNMIVAFLFVISGMLIAIFFYMMNVQKIGLYGILKAIGLKTSTLFKIMWTQMLVITTIALLLAIVLTQSFNMIAPEGMPYYLPMDTSWKLSIVFLVIGFVGATISGLQIRKIQPLQAIQQGEM
ncbi:ABC transporter permease [Lysinibacillus sp. 54212]|uniref:ABC transporter permease n=1 Tax=Lysinibacillus sp. 54212 TaxID=3119829 RepID=UPI002FCC05ED